MRSKVRSRTERCVDSDGPETTPGGGPHLPRFWTCVRDVTRCKRSNTRAKERGLRGWPNRDLPPKVGRLSRLRALLFPSPRPFSDDCLQICPAYRNDLQQDVTFCALYDIKCANFLNYRGCNEKKSSVAHLDPFGSTWMSADMSAQLYPISEESASFIEALRRRSPRTTKKPLW